MNFEEALAEMRKGKKIVVDGGDPVYYGIANGTIETYDYYTDERIPGECINMRDIIDDDWEILDE